MSAARPSIVALTVLAFLVGCGDGGGDDPARPAAPSVHEARYGTIGNALVSEAASQGAPRQRLWIGFSRTFAWRNLHTDIAELPAGKRLWIAGRVVRDPEAPAGFYFDPATTVSARTVGPLLQETLTSLRSRRVSDDRIRAIQVTIDATESTPNAPTCGDRVLDPGEECEIGGFCPRGECDPKLGPCFDFFCRSDCTCPVAECGDYQVQPGEACDPPGSTCNGGTGTCQPGCTCGAARCGDGAINPGEECDTATGYGTCEGGRPCGEDCRCSTEARCGDGAIGPGEQCDLFGCADDERCSDTCTCVPTVCGNGVVELTEQCEPNSPPFDGCVVCDPSTSCRTLACRADCTCDSPCGDGFYGGYDECDDGNLRDGDGCSSECRVECGGEVCPAESVCCDYELGPCAASYTGCTF